MNKINFKTNKMKGLLLVLVAVCASFSYAQINKNQSKKEELDFFLDWTVGGLSPVKKNNRLGFVNSKGKLVVDYLYDVDLMTGYHYNEDDGLIFVKKDKKAGLLNGNGKILVSPDLGYQEIGFFEQTSESEYQSIFFIDFYCPVKRNEKWGFINSKGKEVIKCQYEGVKPVKNGMFAFCVNKKWGIKDLKGKIIIEAKFDEISDFDYYTISSDWEGYFSLGMCPVAKMVNKELVWGYVNSGNELVIPLKYRLVGKFNNEGLSIVHGQENCGCINTNGKEMKPFEFDFADSEFTDGLAVVSKNRKYGFIDTKCNIVIPIEFDYAGGFVKGTSAVQKDGEFYYINKIGLKVAPPKDEE